MLFIILLQKVFLLVQPLCYNDNVILKTFLWRRGKKEYHPKDFSVIREETYYLFESMFLLTLIESGSE